MAAYAALVCHLHRNWFTFAEYSSLTDRFIEQISTTFVSVVFVIDSTPRLDLRFPRGIITNMQFEIIEFAAL